MFIMNFRLTALFHNIYMLINKQQSPQSKIAHFVSHYQQLGLFKYSFKFLLLITLIITVISIQSNLETGRTVQQKTVTQQHDILAEHQQNNGKRRLLDKEEKGNKLSYDAIMQIVIIVVSIVVSTVVIIALICFIDRICCNQSARIKIEAYSLNIDKYCPALSYQLFKKAIGDPLHLHCVICLEDFEQQTKKQQENMIEHQDKTTAFESTVKDKKESSQFHQTYESNKKMLSTNILPHNQDAQQIQKDKNSLFLVRFTICGHLFHAKCLNQWIQRQENCPICREVVSEDNILNWMQNLKVNLQHLYRIYIETPAQEKMNIFDKIFKRNKKVVSNQSLGFRNSEQTLAQLPKSGEREIPIQNQYCQQKMQHHYNSDKLSKNEIYALEIYSKINQYHKIKQKKKKKNSSKMEEKRISTRYEGTQ